MAGCGNPIVTRVDETVEPIMVSQSPIFQSPTTLVSPIMMPTLHLSGTEETESSIVIPTPEYLLPMDIDLDSIALRPEDMTPVFDVTFNITQPYEKPGRRGVDIIYPARVIAHTTGFAEGYKTKVEVYENFQAASEAFYKVISGLSDNLLSEEHVEETVSTIFAGRATEDVSVFTYELVIIKSNVLVVVQIKTDKKISLDILREKSDLIRNRIKEK